jgi:iron complex transport system substrate-binding protein
MMIFLLFLFESCGAFDNNATCLHRVASCNASIDYFDTKINFSHASAFRSVVYARTHVLVDMNWTDWSGAHEQQFVFVRCGCPRPALSGSFALAATFFVPVSSIFIDETVAIPKVMLLGQRSKLTAINSVEFVTTPELRSDVAEGSTVDIKGNWSTLLAAGVPDVLLTGSGFMEIDPLFRDRQLIDADSGETSPLGRAEHVKLTGLLFGAEDTANALFDLVQLRYSAAMKLARSHRKPSVMVGIPWQGNWSVTRGSSYVGQFLRDAGAIYRNAENTWTKPLPALGYLQEFAEAEFWINADIYGAAPMTMEKLIAGNLTATPGGDVSVFPRFRAFQCDNVFVHDNANVPGLPGSPFYELAVLRPDLVLQDLVNMFHGGGNGSMTFYRRLAPLDTSARGRGNVPPCNETTVALPPPAEHVVALASVLLVGVSPFLFDDNYRRTVHPALGTAMQLWSSEQTHQVTVSSSPAPTNTSFAVQFRLSGACGIDDAQCHLALADKLLAAPTALQTVLRNVGAPTAMAASLVNGSETVVLPTGAVVSTAELRLALAEGATLSEGAKWGIAIGVLALLLFVLGGLVIAWKGGKRRAYKEIGN